MKILRDKKFQIFIQRFWGRLEDLGRTKKDILTIYLL